MQLGKHENKRFSRFSHGAISPGLYHLVLVISLLKGFHRPGEGPAKGNKNDVKHKGPQL